MIQFQFIGKDSKTRDTFIAIIITNCDKLSIFYYFCGGFRALYIHIIPESVRLPDSNKDSWTDRDNSRNDCD